MARFVNHITSHSQPCHCAIRRWHMYKISQLHSAAFFASSLVIIIIFLNLSKKYLFLFSLSFCLYNRDNNYYLLLVQSSRCREYSAYSKCHPYSTNNSCNIRDSYLFFLAIFTLGIQFTLVFALLLARPSFFTFPIVANIATTVLKHPYRSYNGRFSVRADEFN